ncbi:MAG: hypothetical protein ABIK62_00700, partial [candidate division WOR-3 bacterium]
IGQTERPFVSSVTPGQQGIAPVVTYNPGEPVQGSSALLWTLMLALFHTMFRDPVVMVWVAKSLGLFFLILAGWLCFRITRILSGSVALAIVGSLMLVTFCPMGWAMVSGMEVTLGVALVLAGVFSALRLEGKPKESWWASLVPWMLFALAVYARPENLLMAVLLFLAQAAGYFLYNKSRPRQASIGQASSLLLGIGLYCILLVPYFALNLALAHSLFPQTYVAKVGRTSLFAAVASGNLSHAGILLTRAPLVYLAGFVIHLWRANPVLTLLALVGVTTLTYRAIRQHRPLYLLLVSLALGYAPAVGATAPFVAPTFQNGRYLGPPTASAAILAALGGWAILGRIRQRQIRYAIAVVLLALTGVNVVTTTVATARNTTQAESSIRRMQVALGKWLRDNAREGDVVACNDVGAIGYFAPCRVIDLLGLVTPEVIAYRNKYPPGSENLAALEYVRRRKPDFLAIFPSWFPNLRDADFLEPVQTFDVRDNTASQWDFQPRPRYIAGLVVADLEVVPMRSTMVLYRCTWGAPESARQ